MASTIEDIRDEANRKARWAWWAGQWNHWPNLIFGIAALVAGVVAGAGGVPDFTVSSVAGFVAGLSGAIASFLKTENSEEKAHYHWKKSSDLKKVAREAKIKQEGGHVTEAELNALNNTLSEIEGRQFEPTGSADVIGAS